MTKTSISVSNSFEQVTNQDLENFADILTDETKTNQFFNQDDEQVANFINSFFHTDNNKALNLLVSSLSADSAIEQLLHYSEKKGAVFIVDILNKLIAAEKYDEVAQILVAYSAVYSLAVLGQGKSVFEILDKLLTLKKYDQVTQILSVHDVMYSLANNRQGKFLVAILNKLIVAEKYDQITQILSVPNNLDNFPSNYREGLVEIINKLMVAKKHDQVEKILTADNPVALFPNNGYDSWIKGKLAECKELKENKSDAVSTAPLLPPPPSGMA